MFEWYRQEQLKCLQQHMVIIEMLKADVIFILFMKYAIALLT